MEVEQREEQETNCPGTRADDEVEEHFEEHESMMQEFPTQGPVKHHKMNYIVHHKFLV